MCEFAECLFRNRGFEQHRPSEGVDVFDGGGMVWRWPCGRRSDFECLGVRPMDHMVVDFLDAHKAHHGMVGCPLGVQPPNNMRHS